MNVHKTTIRYQTVILSLMFFVLPVADMITGSLVLSKIISDGAIGSPSQFGRAILVGGLLFFSKNTKWAPYIFALIFSLFFLELIAGLKFNNLIALIFGVISIFKIVTAPLVYMALSSTLCSRDAVIRYFIGGMILISGSIIIAFLTDTGFSTYGWGFGTKGYFASGNSLGLYLGGSSLLLVCIIKDFEVTGSKKYIALLALWVSLFLVASKTAFLLLILSIGMYLYFFNGILFLLISSAAMVYVFFTYFFQFLETFLSVFISRYNNSSHLSEFLFSGRVDYVINAYEIFIQRNVGAFEWLFGGGVYCSYHGCADLIKYDTLESDLFDLFFSFGLFGAVGYLVFYCCISIKLALRKNVKYFILFTLVYSHSFFAGHVLFNGMSASLLGLIIYFGFLKDEKVY